MEEMVAWLEAELQRRHLNSRVYQSLIRLDEDWYYVPVYVDMRDAYDKAVTLQQIEDRWEQEQIQPGQNILLIPAASPVN